jgi:uncharacterized repeat protein (TIGR01451 family)
MKHRKVLVLPLLIALGLLLTWQIAFAQAPTPNPLPNVTGVDITKVGAAASMQGNPLSGRALFDQNCSTCHGDRGAMGEDNPGSNDGTVPVVNPIDPGFLDDSRGDPTIFAADLDLFLQHGSRPNGPSPKDLMTAWGDTNKLTQQQIADVEAYVMQLNGVYWPGHYYPPAEIQMDAVHGGNVVTYTLTLVNHGGSALTDVVLQDTLPNGLAYIKSGYLQLDNNSGQANGNTVQWLPGDVPDGKTAGPFFLVAGVSGTNVPPNIAQVLFHFRTWNGNEYAASAVSDAIVPK